MQRYLVLLIVLAITVSACGAESSEQTNPAATDAAVEVSDQLVDSEATASSALEAELGFASDPGRRQYQLITLQREADASLVQCMRNAGFFYAVGGIDKSLRAGAFVGDGSREWVQVQGLGITSSFVDALAAGAAGAAPDANATNLGYVESLTAEQAAQYDVALIGEIAAGSESVEYQPEGCWGAAFDDILMLLSYIEAFEPELESLNSRLNADPRMQGFQRAWSVCMSAAGHRYDNESAMVDDVYARLLEIDLVDNAGTTAVVSSDALDFLINFELQVALNSYDCHLGHRDEMAALRNDYEREFLDDNRFRIADMRAPA